MIALCVGKFTYKFLARAIRVIVCCVDEVTAGRHKGIKYLPTFFLWRTPTPIIAKSHRAQAEFRNTQAAFAK